jgi:hypothetical protein
LKRVAADVRDHYVIGYVPDAGAFMSGQGPSARSSSHQEGDLKVRTQGSRRQRPRRVDRAALTGAAARAAISPFTATNIAIRATSPPCSRRCAASSSARCCIDASALTFVKSADGSRPLQPTCSAVFDKDGTEVAHLSTGFAAVLTGERGARRA